MKITGKLLRVHPGLVMLLNLQFCKSLFVLVFWSLYCLSLSFGHCTASAYPFSIFKLSLDSKSSNRKPFYTFEYGYFSIYYQNVD